MAVFNSITQIKGAVDLGLRVKWANSGYDVIRDSLGQYLVIYRPNGHAWGLTNINGDKLNGDISQFFIADQESK